MVSQKQLKQCVFQNNKMKTAFVFFVSSAAAVTGAAANNGACPSYCKAGHCPQDGVVNIRPAELRAKNTQSECWVAIQGKVLDVTNWLSSHPGGSHVFKCGNDMTHSFRRGPHGALGVDAMISSARNNHGVDIVEKGTLTHVPREFACSCRNCRGGEALCNRESSVFKSPDYCPAAVTTTTTTAATTAAPFSKDNNQQVETTAGDRTTATSRDNGNNTNEATSGDNKNGSGAENKNGSGAAVSDNNGNDAPPETQPTKNGQPQEQEQTSQEQVPQKPPTQEKVPETTQENVPQTNDETITAAGDDATATAGTDATAEATDDEPTTTGDDLLAGLTENTCAKLLVDARDGNSVLDDAASVTARALGFCYPEGAPAFGASAVSQKVCACDVWAALDLCPTLVDATASGSLGQAQRLRGVGVAAVEEQNNNTNVEVQGNRSLSAVDVAAAKQTIEVFMTLDATETAVETHCAAESDRIDIAITAGASSRYMSDLPSGLSGLVALVSVTALQLFFL